MDVFVVGFKEGLRIDVDFDVGIARRTAPGAGHALSLEPQRLAVGRALGDIDVEGLAVGQVDALLAAARRHQERYPEAVGDRQAARVEILAVAGAEAEATAATPLP